MLLSILDVLSLSTGYKRPIREGEEYYNSGLLFAVGLLQKRGTVLKCQGLAVQTSLVSGKPHEISITFDISKEEGERINEIECSCIAGQSAKCKHAVATALWLANNTEEDLPDISCTDLEQQWGKLKKSGKPDLEACPLAHLCHVKEKPESSLPEVTDEMKKKWINALMKSSPLSEYCMFYSGLAEEYRSKIFALLRRPSALIDRLAALTKEELEKCDPVLVEFYNNQVAVSLDACVNICVNTLTQSGSSDWFYERGLRFTGSRCYEAFTYISNSKPNWEAKYNSVLGNQFHGNDDTLHGLTCEPLSRDKYIAKKQCGDLQTGLLIRPEIPWYGFSPDGFVLDDNGNIVSLYEIKSTKEGKRLTSYELLSENAVKSLDRNGTLKKKHKHYGQVQLGMLLTGLDSCVYLLYSTVDNDNLEVVPFDELFTFNMCSALCKLYFKEMLHRLLRDKSNANEH